MPVPGRQRVALGAGRSSDTLPFTVRHRCPCATGVALSTFLVTDMRGKQVLSSCEF